VQFLIFNRPPDNFPRWGDIGGCVTHWIGLHRAGRTISYPIVGLKGYATFLEAGSAKELLEVMKGNPLWSIEEYKIFILDDEGPLQEVPVVANKQRFLVMARPHKPLPQRANVEGSRRHFMALHEKYGAAVYPLVQDDGIGMAIVVNAASHDELHGMLSANPLGSWGSFEVFAIATLEGEEHGMIEAGIIREIDAADTTLISVNELLSGLSGQTVIDLRPAHEFAQGHIPGSLAIPAEQLLNRLNELPTGGGAVTLVCRTGTRSLQAVRQMAECGVPARSLDGGLNRWRAQGGELRNSAGTQGEIV
jgi:rhodanese-related sulfurtransferase